MPDNVIPILRGAARESNKALVEKAAEEKRIVSDRLRAKSMRKRLDDKPMIHKETDRIHVAKNLGRILNEVRAKGQKVEQVLRKLGMGKEGDSTKQLRNYALAEDATLESSGKQIRVLAKTASLYLRIAEGAAEAMGEDVDLIVVRLFENTSYQVADDVPDEKIASMDQVRELLAGMAEAAIRRNDLHSYLDILQSRRIGWDIDGAFGRFGSLPTSVFLGDRAARHVSYLGYAPTVLLYRRDVGPLDQIEGEAFQIDFQKDPEAVNRFLRENQPLPKKHKMPVNLNISREVWFGIGPMEAIYTWKPIFEKRLSFHIAGHAGPDRSLHVRSYDPSILFASTIYHEDVPDRLLWLHQFTLLPRCPGGSTLSVSVSPHIDTLESVSSDNVQRKDLEDRWLIALKGFSSSSLSVDDDVDPTKGQFFYETVDLESCVKYLDEVADPEDWDTFDGECGTVSLNRQLWPSYEEREAWYQDLSWDGLPEMHVVSPKGSIARAIEQNLLREDCGYRLDNVLFETVAQRIQAACEYYRRVLQDREDRVAGLLSSWKEA